MQFLFKVTNYWFFSASHYVLVSTPNPKIRAWENVTRFLKYLWSRRYPWKAFCPSLHWGVKARLVQGNHKNKLTTKCKLYLLVSFFFLFFSFLVGCTPEKGIPTLAIYESHCFNCSDGMKPRNACTENLFKELRSRDRDRDRDRDRNRDRGETTQAKCYLAP